MEIDQLVFGAPTRDAAVTAIEERLGVTPDGPGMHRTPDLFSRSLSLGDATHIEVVAPNRDAGMVLTFGAGFANEPRLLTWGVRAHDVEAAVLRVRASGVEQPFGMTIRFDHDPGGPNEYSMTQSHGGVVPFLISYRRGRPDRAGKHPSGCRLLSLRAEHPEPDIRRELDALGANIEVSRAGLRVDRDHRMRERRRRAAVRAGQSGSRPYRGRARRYRSAAAR
ncbi:MAG: hypothetical protein GEU80_06905 [Dehalococcoidia bacterium]|nr:hypothetical protein [Dehalococcoidia bacterium]